MPIMGRKRIYVIPKKQFNKAISALRKSEYTTFGFIVIQQAFNDNGMQDFNGDSAYELSNKMTDKFFAEFLPVNNKRYSEADLQKATSGLYEIISAMLKLSD